MARPAKTPERCRRRARSVEGVGRNLTVPVGSPCQDRFVRDSNPGGRYAYNWQCFRRRFGRLFQPPQRRRERISKPSVPEGSLSRASCPQSPPGAARSRLFLFVGDDFRRRVRRRRVAGAAGAAARRGRRRGRAAASAAARARVPRSAQGRARGRGTRACVGHIARAPLRRGCARRGRRSAVPHRSGSVSRRGGARSRGARGRGSEPGPGPPRARQDRAALRAESREPSRP